jgi:hypothetical protein
MIDPRTLADSMLADDQAIIDATSKAHEALAAWAACPPIIRRAYVTDASRLAGRAAAALVRLLQVAQSAGDALD